MSAPSSPNCPFHAEAPTPAPVPHPAGVWPPGPPVALTGWSLLPLMARDLLGALKSWQREYGDIVHLRIWPEHELVVADPQLARELLVTHHDALIRWERGIEVFTRLEGRSVLVAEGKAWRAKRHALMPAFSPKSVQAFVPMLAAAADQALAQWPSSAPDWPIESALTSLAMDVIVRMLFSSEIGSDARRAERAAHTAIAASNAELFWPASWPDRMPWKRAKRKALAELKGLIDGHLQARLKLPHDAWPDDLLTRLLQLHREDPAAWPLQAVHDECLTAFIAGHETTAATMSWWAWCMAAHPEAQEAAREEVRQALQGRPPSADDLPALRCVTRTLQETLRLYPAAPLLFSRRSTRPLTLGPWQVPARTMFLVPVHLMQRDARWFPEPLAFRPERFGPGAPEIPRGAYMPFGTGARVCLGQHLAMAEMTLIAAMVLQRFVLSVPEGMAPPRPALKISLRPDRPLHLRIESPPAP